MSVLCGLPFAAYIWSACAAPPPLAVGYVEGDYVMLAPIEVAQVTQVAVHRGQTVEAGAEVARLEDTDARIAVSQSEAALSQARAQLADLKLGKRPEEIAVLEAAVRSAEAQLRETQRTLARVEDLSKRGIATQAQLDQATTSNEMAEAQLGQAKANLAVAGLAAREEAIKAAESQVEQAQATLDNARWRLTQRVIAAPSAGRVNDVIRNAGDIAGPSAPVVSLLPDGAVKLKLYVPEEAFSSVKVGDALRVRCDGCPPGLSARVSYVSPEPEFTPPVIYSIETRQKLVYLVEARPEEADTRLQPGQIVDVELGQ
ncbi:HlyD family secretion protein [Aquibium oceanicum]|uniref:HlyD family secretion protein n=1 Tax=Aquibium oceanicum TaxID=1670800 RepID=A0A1L3SMG6_9HYPH|nr:HlyD family efflux transporter periplasmic adaptor subunit [Aquibium oceanicum]APH70584.1 HlyD family secretion protein [Aquibium oceanicum]